LDTLSYMVQQIGTRAHTTSCSMNTRGHPVGARGSGWSVNVIIHLRLVPISRISGSLSSNSSSYYRKYYLGIGNILFSIFYKFTGSIFLLIYCQKADMNLKFYVSYHFVQPYHPKPHSPQKRIHTFFGENTHTFINIVTFSTAYAILYAFLLSFMLLRYHRSETLARLHYSHLKTNYLNFKY